MSRLEQIKNIKHLKYHQVCLNRIKLKTSLKSKGKEKESALLEDFKMTLLIEKMLKNKALIMN